MESTSFFERHSLGILSMLWVGFVGILLLLLGYTDAQPDEDELEFENVWAKLQDGLDEMRGGKQMKRSRAMELYTVASDYCLESSLKSDKGKIKCGRKGLFDRLQWYLQDVVDSIYKEGNGLSGEDILNYYATQWDSYLSMSKKADGIFAYFNRYWIMDEYKKGNLQITRIKDLAIAIWKDHMVALMLNNVTTGMLKLIERERNGEKVDTELLKKIINSFDFLDHLKLERQPTQDGSEPEFYREYFERRFIADTENYYGREAAEFIAKHPVAECIEKMETRLNEEMQRRTLYLHQSTNGSLAKTLDEALASKYLYLIQNEFENLLKSNQISDLKRLTELCSRVEILLNGISEVLEKYIARQGRETLDTIAAKAINNPKQYVSKILEVYNRYQELVNQVFGNEPIFRKALDEACRLFINNNSLTDKDRSKSPELFARYCNILLKKNERNAVESELDELLKQILTVFEYVNNKNAFEKFYNILLASRLVNEKSADIGAEKKMVAKLEEICGKDYTDKMERMLNDIETSKDMTKKFKQHRADVKLDFSIKILFADAWPFKQLPDFNLPLELSKCMESFMIFYETQYLNRKLTWQPTRGHGELSTTCFDKPYILVVTIPQMAFLMLFNENEELSLQHTCISTGLTRENVTGIVQRLATAELLLAVSPMVNNDERAAHTTMLKINPGFSKKQERVDLRMAMKERKEVVEASEKSENDLKFLLDATIMGTMKAKKQVKHTDLINEVFSELPPKFHPNVSMVKDRIEN